MTETKKEAFRKYLENAGAIDSLTRILVALYEEQDRPASATEYIKGCLGGPSADEYEQVIAENKQLQADLQQARKQVDELSAKLAELSGDSGAAEGGGA
jgi:hypothetical protein